MLNNISIEPKIPGRDLRVVVFGWQSKTQQRQKQRKSLTNAVATTLTNRHAVANPTTPLGISQKDSE